MGDDIKAAPVQQKLLIAILRSWDSRQRIPTYEELASQHEMAKSGVQYGIMRLLKKGFLECERTPHDRVKAGSIRPTRKALMWQLESREQAVPKSDREVSEEPDTRPARVIADANASVRAIVSNAPGADEEHILLLPPHHGRHPDVFILRVVGESMSGDDLHSGDHLIVDPRARFSDGDMVVVLDGETVRVKRLWDDGSHIILESSNSEFDPIVLEKGKEHLGGPVVQGKVVGRILWHVKPGERNK